MLNPFSVIDILVSWGLGWRYLLSPKYRQAVHDRWAAGPRTRAIGEAICAGFGFLLINGLLFLFAMLVGTWLYQGIVVPRLSR